MTIYPYNSEKSTKQVLDLLSALCTADTSYPETNAKMPFIIVNEPIQTPRQLQYHVNLRFTIDVWHNKIFDVSRLFDKVVEQLGTLNILLVNNTPNFQDPLTKKWRKTGNFEVRFNQLTNAYEITK